MLGILKNFKIKSGKQYITNTYTNKVYNFENNEIMDYCGDIINGKLKLVFPLLFIFGFVFLRLFLNFYKNQTLKAQQNNLL